MGIHFLILLTATALQIPQTDTVTVFSTPIVEDLVTRATARRRMTDSAVADYRATVQYRLSLGFGRRQWSRVPPAVVEEQVAQVQWRLPNDLRVDVEGQRSRSRSGMVALTSVFDRPWFVPRDVGDSLRIFSNDFPATGALHPLSAAGPAWYRYTQAGGLGVALPDGRKLRLIEIEVTPRRTGPALITGRLWIDSATADVVRLAFRYVGTSLWARVGDPEVKDSSKARRINAIANRVLSINAEIEYAMQEGRYWMPYRQAVFGTARIPVISDLVVPFRAVTTFDDYAINTGRPIAFTVPLDSAAARRASRDTLRVTRRGGEPNDPDGARPREYAGRWPGGRYEMHRPAEDSLKRYTGWTAPLELRNPSGEDDHLLALEGTLAEAAEALPGSLTGRSEHGVGYERFGDVVQYNRVEGLSFGAGYRVRVPMLKFTSLYATARYGLSDRRLTGRLAIRADAPGGRLTLAGYRSVRGVDPFAPGQTFENSTNAMFAAHDDGDYLVATGASVEVETSIGLGVDLAAGARVERERSAAQTARSAVNDWLGGAGLFPPNPAVAPGTYGGMFVRVVGFGALRWSLTADILGSEQQAVGRLYGEARRNLGGRRGATIRVKAGAGTEPGGTSLPQMAFRLGGQPTVRGFAYGAEQAPSFWAAQFDVTPFAGLIRPVAFMDAGQAGRTSALFSQTALVGGGVGLSFLRGMIRFDFSVPISPDVGGKVRFDLVLRGVR